MDLLSQCTSGGCGAKIAPGALSNLLNTIPVFPHPNMLVGFDTGDDAAVYQISPDKALVSTVDFFSPMVNDPVLFGKIAAANALSDVYAMGGVPLFALNLVCFPEKMDHKILEDILYGGALKLQEAQVPLGGGHSIYDKEIKYGLAVTGEVHPDKMIKNNACREKDILVLTKPLGVGIIMAAKRVNMAQEDHYLAAVSSMETLNKYAMEKALTGAVHSGTDITGFGFLAHLLEMLDGSYTAYIDPDKLPLLPGAYNYAARYLLTAAGQRNRKHVEQYVDKDILHGLAFPLQEIMLDPQTSGGLLLALPEASAAETIRQIQTVVPCTTAIGVIAKKENSAIQFEKGVSL